LKKQNINDGIADIRKIVVGSDLLASYRVEP